MHELGVVFEVIKTVERFASDNQLTSIEKLVLQIGELSSMIPRYVEACYPCAVEGTLLEKTVLEIEVLPGNGLCAECENVFNLVANANTCPHCNCQSWTVLSGKEFMIKEVVAC